MWQYKILRYGFAGPGADDWPRAEEFRELYETARSAPRLGGGVFNPFADENVARVSAEYWEWAAQFEADVFNEMGRLGFELVTYQPLSTTSYQAVFKRPTVEGQQQAPDDFGLPKAPSPDWMN
jgi:hypothetical protein